MRPVMTVVFSLLFCTLTASAKTAVFGEHAVNHQDLFQSLSLQDKALVDQPDASVFGKLKLDRAKRIEFLSLSKEVQTQLRSDEALRQRAAKAKLRAALDNGIMHDDDCDDDDDPQTCVRRCNARWSDGSCRTWGSDYCGRNAACAEYCSARWSDGSCRSYGADFCGEDAVCSANCTARWSDGSCRTWGADVCF